MLLHVIAPPLYIDQPANPAALPDLISTFNKMQHRPIFPVRHFSHAYLAAVRKQHRTGVKDLAPAGRIKSRAIQHNRRPRVGRRNLANLGVKFVEKRIVIVKTFSLGDFVES
jgi:hypothetical protein